MLIVASTAAMVEDIGVLIVCLVAGIALLAVQFASTRELGLWTAVAVRTLLLVFGLAFLAVPTLTIAGIIPWDESFQW
jgi:hypothetical protein